MKHISRKTFRKREQGFTLIEVLASVVILEIIAVSIMGMFALSSRTKLLSEEKLQVVNLLQRKMEEALSRDYTDDVVEPYSATNYYPGYEDYTFEVQVTGPPYKSLDMKRLDVTITWQSAMGGTRSETISTIVAGGV